MTRSVEVTVYELRWEGTDEVYVGSTVLKLSDRLAQHRCAPRACYAHLDINKATIVPVLTYRTSDRFNRKPEAAHKARLISKNIPLLVDPNDNHNQALWHSDKTKACMSTAQKGKQFNKEHKRKISEGQKGAKNHQYAPFTVTWPDGRVDRWDTTHEAAAAYGVSYRSIWNYLNNKTTPGNHKSSAHLKGTIWQYV